MNREELGISRSCLQGLGVSGAWRGRTSLGLYKKTFGMFRGVKGEGKRG